MLRGEQPRPSSRVKRSRQSLLSDQGGSHPHHLSPCSGLCWAHCHMKEFSARSNDEVSSLWNFAPQLISALLQNELQFLNITADFSGPLSSPLCKTWGNRPGCWEGRIHTATIRPPVCSTLHNCSYPMDSMLAEL